VRVPQPRHVAKLSPILGQATGRQVGGAEIAFRYRELCRREDHRNENHTSPIAAVRALLRKELIEQAFDAREKVTT
jgi:hypothetical protein